MFNLLTLSLIIWQFCSRWLNIFCKKIENLYNWMDNLCIKVQNIVAKGEIARFEQFLLLSVCFQKVVCCRGTRKRLYEGKGKVVESIVAKREQSSWAVCPLFSTDWKPVKLMSMANCLLCVYAYANIFSSVSYGSIGMKLHSKNPLNVLTKIPSIVLDPFRILVSMASKRIKL